MAAEKSDLLQSPRDRRDEGLRGILSRQNEWKSAELQKLLNEQLERKENLTAKKAQVEKDIAKLGTEKHQEMKKEFDQLHQVFKKLRSQVKQLMKDKLPTKLENPDFYRKMETTDELERASAYLTVINFFKVTSEQIDANMETELESEAIELFHRLKRIEIAYLENTDCSNLQRYGKAIIAHWESRLQSKLVKDFETLLQAFGWPTRLRTATPTLETHEKFRKAVLNLSRISCSTSGDDLDELQRSRKTILPIEIMIAPLRKRFKFHFFSDKPTNESSRPEWYFAQIKTWIRELIPFLRTHLEPVSMSEIKVSSIVEFVGCLSEMLILKIDAQLQENVGDAIFVRILEEAISYENDISGFIQDEIHLTEASYLPPFVNTVFSQQDILNRWLDVERKACLEKLDEMFSSPSGWNKPVVPGPPEIVDLFLAVIRCLTDRFAHLQEPKHRLQFLQLFIDLLEDFHVRCLQMWQSKTDYEDYNSKDVLVDYIMADGLEFVHDTIQEWEYLPFFASLASVQDTTQEEESETFYGTPSNSTSENSQSSPKGDGIFANVCSLYWCLSDEIQSKWCQRIMRRVRDETHTYATHKWQAFKPGPPESISEQLLIPIQTLKDVGKAVVKSMDRKVAERWMKKLAIRLDELLLNTVVFPNRFSQLAVTQLDFDFTHGIFPVVSEKGLNINKTLFFGNMCSALKILNLSTGEAMLLYDTLMNGTFEAHESALAELDISICNSEAIKVLRGRYDLHH